MFKNIIAHFSLLSIANGLSIGDTPLNEEMTNMLAEVAVENSPAVIPKSDKHDTDVCRTWVSFLDWDLFYLCDDNAPGGKKLRGDSTINELKSKAELSGFDGFTVFPDNDWGSEAVYFKHCEFKDSSPIVD